MTTTHSRGHVAPLGQDATRKFDESRFQQLIPARYLPGVPTRIDAVAVVGAAATATVGYDRLEIRLGHATSGTLSSTFDDNLADMVTVVDIAGGAVRYDFAEWSTIPFDRAFDYDGRRPLIVEIRKRVRTDPATTSASIVASRIDSNPGRSDLPVARFTYGPIDSGAIDASVATHALPAPMSIRFSTSSDTLTVESPRGGALDHVFPLDGRVTLEVRAKSGTYFAILGFPGFGPPIVTPPLEGVAHLPVTVALPIASGSSAAPRTELLIPRNEALVGYHAAFQAAVLDFANGSIVWTNAIDFFVNP
ncbi:MAG: hypothetical protein KDB80_03280 [Planctomycetes bacterium]|nr:hypothetical protein [Planctomycetota bacterium]